LQKIELVPDLDHCIETVAKTKHSELVQILLESKAGNSEIEEKLETLRLFLETITLSLIKAPYYINIGAGNSDISPHF